jgi:hypothetical protein
MQWFKHKSDARNSLKLRKVRRKYGADGYAIYWFCLEAIAYEVDKDNLTFELKEDAETIAFELCIQEKRVEEIMHYMVDIGLFESSSNMITCMKLAESIDKSMTNSPKMRAWLETKSVMTCADDVMTLPDSVKTCAELEVEKKRKEKKVSKKDLDWSATQMSESEILEIKRLRQKAKADVTQRVINQLANQFELSRKRGYSNDDILNEWSLKGWRAFKDEWIKSPPSNKVTHNAPQPNHDPLKDFDLL